METQRMVDGAADAFDVETATYEAHRDELVATHREEFVAVFGTAVLGTGSTWDQAFELGLSKVGRLDFLVRRIQPAREHRIGLFTTVRW